MKHAIRWTRKIPDPIMFWCMGGGAGNLLLGQPGYCDGER